MRFCARQMKLLLLQCVLVVVPIVAIATLTVRVHSSPEESEDAPSAAESWRPTPPRDHFQGQGAPAAAAHTAEVNGITTDATSAEIVRLESQPPSAAARAAAAAAARRAAAVAARRAAAGHGGAAAAAAAGPAPNLSANLSAGRRLSRSGAGSAYAVVGWDPPPLGPQWWLRAPLDPSGYALTADLPSANAVPPSIGTAVAAAAAGGGKDAQQTSEALDSHLAKTYAGTMARRCELSTTKVYMPDVSCARAFVIREAGPYVCQRLSRTRGFASSSTQWFCVWLSLHLLHRGWICVVALRWRDFDPFSPRRMWSTTLISGVRAHEQRLH